MKNIYADFSVDWVATGRNLSHLMEGVITQKVLAESMYMDPRTISSWCSGSSHPSIDQLILLSKFFHVDLSELLVTKGEAEQVDLGEKKTKKRVKPSQMDVKTRGEFVKCVLYHTYVDRTDPIQTLDEFLLFLPLFSWRQTVDFFRRAEGNWGNGNYLREKLKFLCDHIQNQEAKAYAEYYRDRYLSRLLERTNREQEETEEPEEEFAAYREEYRRFLEHLHLLDRVLRFDPENTRFEE